MFRAYDPQRERLVAVKLFKLDLPPERVHRLVSEFERLIAADLTHPSIAAPLVTGMTGVSAFLAQDYVAAESLDLTVREYGPAPPADALRVAAQLAGALDFASAANISHGALHPRDVLLSSDETRLTGIGVAYALEQVGVSAPVRRPYTAPERIAGATWDRRTDIFSFAALIHELLWARRVSGTGSQAALGLTAIEGADLDALRGAFARALADDPLERFETALEFAEALAHAFPGVTIVSPQSGMSSRSLKRAPRRSDRGSRAADSGLKAESDPRLPLDEADQIDARSEGERDLDLPVLVQGDADEARFRDIELAATLVDPEPDVHEPPVDPGGPVTGLEPEPMAVLAGQSRSGVWPLMLALTIGLAMGFGGGYWAGTGERSAPAPPVAFVAPVTAPVTAPAAAPTPAVVAPPPQAEMGRLKPDPATGRLLVRSTPPDAQVTIDGEESGRTPVTVRNLGRGAHRVRISREGFTTEERRIVLTRLRPTQSMTVALARPRAAESRAARPGTPPVTPPPVAPTGGFAVESRPAGAKVYLDGKLVGTTPLSIPAVPAGEHAVRLERDGYRQWSTSVKVMASETNHVTASLEK